jgi:uncharacterized membrane protein
MNYTKLFLCAFVSLLAVAALSSAASLNITAVSVPPTVQAGAGSFNVVFNISNTGLGANITLSNAVSQGAITGITYSVSNPFQLLENTSSIVTATISFSQSSGVINGSITADPSGQGSSRSLPYSVTILSSSSLSVNRLSQPTYRQNASFTVSNTGDSALSSIGLTSSSSAFTILPSSTISSLSARSSSGTFTLALTSPTVLKFGDNTVTVTAASGNVQGSNDFVFQKTFCKNGATLNGNLSLSDISIDTDGSDDLEWKPLETVTIEVDVEDIADTDARNVKVEIGLFNDEGRNVIGDMDFENSDDKVFDIGTINDGDRETATFKFKIPGDTNEGTYRLAVKAFSTRAGESNECTDLGLGQGYYESITVNRQSDNDKLIAVDNIAVPEQVTCGETISGNFEVFNVGDEDQDQIKIEMRGTELGVSQDFEIRENLDMGDSKEVSFNFKVPTNLRDGYYRLGFKPLYNYRNGNYRDESDETFYGSVRVMGCSYTGPSTPSSDITIDASLASSAEPGKELVIEAQISNSGNEQKTFTVDATGYQTWAQLSSISKRVVTLAPGRSETVTLKFNINSDVSGSESFLLQVGSAGQLETQEVEVLIKEQTSTGFTFGGNNMIWIIAAVNLVLILLIVFIAIRLSRR